jgi:hypothetical protein
MDISPPLKSSMESAGMLDVSWPSRRLPDLDSEVVPSGLASEVEAYWRSVRRGQPMPTRRDIDPAALKNMLPNVFLLDVVGYPARFRWRLVGTKIVTVLRTEQTGKWLDQGGLASGDPFLSFCRVTMVERRPTCHIARWQDLDGRTKPLMRCLLPLSDDSGQVTMLFGAVDFAPSQIMMLHRGAA